MFLVSLRNILNLLGVQPFMQDFVTGLLIILAVLVTVQGPRLRDAARTVRLRTAGGRTA